jgi:hypothetical protein
MIQSGRPEAALVRVMDLQGQLSRLREWQAFGTRNSREIHRALVELAALEVKLRSGNAIPPEEQAAISTLKAKLAGWAESQQAIIVSEVHT